MRRIDPSETRQHILSLMAEGVPRERIARQAGVSSGYLSDLVNGCKGHSGRRVYYGTISPLFAEVVLAVRSSDCAGQANWWTNPTGSRRRVEALMAIGYSALEQAHRIGKLPNPFRASVWTAKVIHPETAKAIAKLYDQLWCQPRALDGQTLRTLKLAARKGYAPPQAWDDDSIDDPIAIPNLGISRPEPMIDLVKIERVSHYEMKFDELNELEQARFVADSLKRGIPEQTLRVQCGFHGSLNALKEQHDRYLRHRRMITFSGRSS